MNYKYPTLPIHSGSAFNTEDPRDSQGLFRRDN